MEESAWEHTHNPWYTQLVVNGHRLFIGLWSNAPLQMLPSIGQGSQWNHVWDQRKLGRCRIEQQVGGANLELRHHTDVWRATRECPTVCPYRWISCHIPFCCAGFGFEWKTNDVWCLEPILWCLTCTTSIAMSLLAAAGGMGIWWIWWTWG